VVRAFDECPARARPEPRPRTALNNDLAGLLGDGRALSRAVGAAVNACGCPKLGARHATC
jgi:hypothetical protein